MKVVLTRESGKNHSLVEWFPEGASVAEVPLTRTRYYVAQEVKASLERSDAYGAFHSLVVTSERSAPYVHDAVTASAPDVEIFSVGPVTTASLEGSGFTIRRQGDGGSISLAAHIRRGPVLLLGASEMRRDLADDLRERGLDVTMVSCYETVAVELTDVERALLRDADVVFIGAPSAWDVAREHVDARAWIVVPGATTGAVVAAEHERVLEGWGPHLRERLTNAV